MAEQLRERRCLNEAAEWFQKALKTNPLDYRIYVGLAMTCLQGNNFDKARELLEKSLHHAPGRARGANRVEKPLEDMTQQELARWYKARKSRGEYDETDSDDAYLGDSLGFLEQPQVGTSVSDYRSLSYRLIGRIFACKEDWANAASSLRSAITISPAYEEGNYEYAQYCVQSGDRREWSASLRKAIVAKPAYWYMACAERNFAPVRKDLASLLKALTSEARRSAIGAIAEAERTLQTAEQAIGHLRVVAGVSGGGSLGSVEASIRTYNNAAENLARAKRDTESADYRRLLNASREAGDSKTAAEHAKEEATREIASLKLELGRAKSEAARSKADTAMRLSLGGLCLCCLPLALAGLVVGILALFDFKQVADQEGKGRAVVAVILGTIPSALVLCYFLVIFIALMLKG